MKWEERLLAEAKQIVKHGQGKLTLDVGPYSTDQTSILVVAGRGHRFTIPRGEIEEED